jgi:arylsulfatase A-like enzyme
MPTVVRDLTNGGVTFSNVPNPLCCPSRVSTLTGLYSHTTGVYGISPPHGGFASFKPIDSVTIATALHDAGYRTGLVGKYLNGYPVHHWDYEPPGWDR